MVSMLSTSSEARFARAIDSVRARVFSSEPWSLRPRVDDATVRALHVLETSWTMATTPEERALLASQAEELIASLTPRRLLPRRDGAAERKRFADAYYGLAALLRSIPIATGGGPKVYNYYSEASKVVEVFKNAKDDASELGAAREMEALYARARDDFGAGRSLVPNMDWRKWALVGGGVLGGVVLLRALLR